MDDDLPNLLIAGVPRAGTTSLFAYLGQHPDICPSEPKEPGYFLPIRSGQAPTMSREDYARCFSRCDPAVRYRMEATPHYFLGGRPMIEAVLATLGEPRALVSLRDPVDRLWSTYWFLKYRRKSGLDVDFDTFVGYCEDAARDERTAPAPGPREIAGAVMAGGWYAAHVDEWCAALGSRFKIVFLDDIQADPGAVLGDILEWLELPPALDDIDLLAKNPTFAARNRRLHSAATAFRKRAAPFFSRRPRLHARLTGWYARLNARRVTHEKLDQPARERLQALYAGPNRDLASALRRHGYTNLPPWLSCDRGDEPADRPEKEPPEQR